MGAKQLIYVTVLGFCLNVCRAQNLPLIVTTWPWSVNATATAWDVIYNQGRSRVDAAVEGAAYCETNACSLSVGPRWITDEKGEITLDALVMDGPLHEVGGVGALRRVKNAVGVARAVMTYSEHTLLVGDQATAFAVEMGFTEEDLSDNTTNEQLELWKAGNCQPNFRKNVVPDPTENCGPYSPAVNMTRTKKTSHLDVLTNAPEDVHDTICVLAVDADSNVAVATSTNGLRWKIPGRVGDTPIAGAGAYVDNQVGGATATGNGDIMMRFLPCYHAVEMMRQGMTPAAAAREAILRITQYYPTFSGAVIAANIDGEYGASCSNVEPGFSYTVRNENMVSVTTEFAFCV